MLRRILHTTQRLAILIVIASFVNLPIKALENGLNPGFIAFFNNDYQTAIDYFSKQIEKSPSDPSQYNHLAQAILYRELYRNGALESQLVGGNNAFLHREKIKIQASEKSRLMRCLDKAQALSEARLKKNHKDPLSLYELGVTHGLRANYFFLVEKAWTDALGEASAARKENERVLELDPSFVDANLILGVDQYVVGSLPFYLRAVGFFGGFHGDKQEGIHKLELVACNGSRNRYDAQVLLAVLYRREHHSRKAIPLLRNLAAKFPGNNLFRFEQVQMYSDVGDKKSALAVLTSIEHQRRAGVAGFANIPEAKIRYVAGNLNFWYGDLPAALSSLNMATKQADQLDLSMAVLAWLRLGQVHDLSGNHDAARTAYEQSMRTAPDSDAASEAKDYLSKPYKRKQKSDKSG